MTVVEAQLYSHLVDMLCFFVKAHTHRAKYFILQDNLPSRVAQLFKCREKHLKLSALKYFRISISGHDAFHYRRLMDDGAIEPVLDILLEFMPKDTLLNSACLEFFEHIRREHAKELLLHVVETHREKIEKLSHIETFKNMLTKYDQFHNPIDELSFTTVDTEQTPQRPMMLNGNRWSQSLKEMEAEEEAYFNSEENDEDELLSPTTGKQVINGASPVKPLVDYPEDDDEDLDLPTAEPFTNGFHPSPEPEPSAESAVEEAIETTQPSRDETPSPPGRLAEKRRRLTDDDDDELGKLSASKRRASFGSGGVPPVGILPVASSDAPAIVDSPQEPVSSGPTHTLRRKRKVNIAKEAREANAKKITISLGSSPAKEEEQKKKSEKKDKTLEKGKETAEV
jgi:protein phosphatase-4 regulatory subunit 3